MKAIHPLKIAGLFRAPAWSECLIFISSVFAECSYVADSDLDRKIAAGPEGLSRDNTHARATNDAEQLVGESSTVGGASHAFMTGSGGKRMTDSGTPRWK
jgi:hypothetical protein